MPKVKISDSKGLHQVAGTGIELGGAVLTSDGLNCGALGLNPTWNLNFGGATLQAAGGPASARVLDVLTPADTMLRQVFALRQIAQQGTDVTAAQAAKIFGVAAGVAGSTLNLGSIVATSNIIPPTLSVKRIEGDLAAQGGDALTLDDSATDLAEAGDQSLILFTGNNIAASQVLTIGFHTNNEFDAESGEFFTTTTSGLNVLEREVATTDGHQDIVLTASATVGGVNILAGSFIYMIAGAAADTMTIKMCLLTTGGKIAITTAA